MNPIFEKPSRGFTLIELMVVIAIITVLTLIAIPHHRHGADRSSWRACHSTNMTLQSALELYSMDNPASSASILPGNPTMPDNLLFRRGYARQITP